MARSLLSHRSSYLSSSTSSSLPRVDLSSADLPRTLSRPRLSFALPVPLRFPVPRLSTPPPVCCGAAHPLSRHQPLVGRRAYPHDFPYPHPPPPASRASATFYTRFLYLLREFTDQHDRLDYDERTVSRSSVKILGAYFITYTFSIAGFAIYAAFHSIGSTYSLCL